MNGRCPDGSFAFFKVGCMMVRAWSLPAVIVVWGAGCGPYRRESPGAGANAAVPRRTDEDASPNHSVARVENTGPATSASVPSPRCPPTQPKRTISFEDVVGRQKGCRLSDDYDIKQACVVMDALRRAGFHWERTLIAPPDGDWLSTARGPAGPTLVVNPRSRGEVMLDVNGQTNFYCVGIGGGRVDFSLWTMIES